MATVDARFVNDSGVTELEGTIDLPNGSGDTLATVLAAGSDADGGSLTGVGSINAQTVTTDTVDVVSGTVTIDSSGVTVSAAVGVSVGVGDGAWASDTGTLTTSGGNLTTAGGTGNGNVTIKGALDHNGATAGFYGTAPAAQPQVPAIPIVQDVVDALVTLGLITQAP